MTSELLRNIERFETAQAELRETIREAHSVLKELRGLIREANECRDAVKAGVYDSVNEAVAEAVAEMGTKTREAMDRATDKVMAEFDRLTALLFTGTDKGEGYDLRDEIDAWVQRNGSVKAARKIAATRNGATR